MKGKRQGKNGKRRIIIQPNIEEEHYEALRTESDRRKVTMNFIIREMLEERYNVDG